MSAKTFELKKAQLLSRWSVEDYPGGTPHFQPALLAKDIGVFCLLPLLTVILFKMIEGGDKASGKSVARKLSSTSPQQLEKQSQIVWFTKAQKGGSTFSRIAPGTLVHVRLLNLVEAAPGGPVQARILDASLGPQFLGGTLTGEASANPQLGKINIEFKFARPNSKNIAAGISARALALDGTLGIEAEHKEGIFARASTKAFAGLSENSNPGNQGQDFKTLIANAVAHGLLQEFQNDASVGSARAQILTLRPASEFFVELTNFFPTSH